MAKQDEEIKLFVRSGCSACDKIKDIVAKGRFNKPSVDLIDINTPEGEPYLDKLPINKVPVAMKGNKTCELELTSDADGEILLIDCGEGTDHG